MAAAEKRQKTPCPGLTIKKRFSLRPDQRIRGRTVFRLLFKKGHFSRGDFLNLWAYRKEEPEGQKAASGPKLGIIVSRKTNHRAAVRNLWKRRIRESFRKNQHRIKQGVSLLVESRRGAKHVPSYDAIAQDMEKLLSRTGSLK